MKKKIVQLHYTQKQLNTNLNVIRETGIGFTTGLKDRQIKSL